MQRDLADTDVDEQSDHGSDHLRRTKQLNNGKTTHRHSNLVENLEASKNGVCGPNFFAQKESLLEKILQERLRLVQQMGELNKQHARTQEELADLEAKTIEQQQQQSTQ